MSLVEACSGAAGGVFSVAVMCPLDLAKTRRQIYGKKGGDPRYASWASSLRTIVQEGGPLALYTGISSRCLQNAIMNFGQFYWMSVVKRVYLANTGGPALSRSGRPLPMSPWVSLALNMVAAMVNQSTNVPFEVVSTRITAGTGGGGVLGTVRKIVGESGIAGLWKGLMVSMVICINPAINFAILDALRPYIRKVYGLGAKQGFTLWQSFVMGVLAKAITTVITFPIIRTKVMLQAKGGQTKGGQAKGGQGTVGKAVVPEAESAGEGGETKETAETAEAAETAETAEAADEGGAMDLLRGVYEKDGFWGWYLGIEPQIINASLKSGLMIMSKDRIKAVVRSVMLGDGGAAATQ